jgi:hypothetical protein
LAIPTRKAWPCGFFFAPQVFSGPAKQRFRAVAVVGQRFGPNPPGRRQFRELGNVRFNIIAPGNVPQLPEGDDPPILPLTDTRPNLGREEVFHFDFLFPDLRRKAGGVWGQNKNW